MTRPIFIVGMPRSGSTVFYATLARHPDLAWISQATKKFPRSVWLSRLVMAVRSDRRPTEGHRIWRKFARSEDDTLGREHATPAMRRYYTDLVQAHLRLQGKSRFLSKHTRNVLRLECLDEIFPDALFLHLVRDGRGVARSILDMRASHGGREVYWGVRPPGWRSLVGLEPIEAIAHQWRMTIEYARDSATRLDKDRYLEIRYEDFCDHPAAVLERVGEWAGLAWPTGLLDRITAGIRSQNYKWRETFETAEVAAFEEIAGDLLRDFGYETDYPRKNRIERSVRSISGAQ